MTMRGTAKVLGIIGGIIGLLMETQFFTRVVLGLWGRWDTFWVYLSFTGATDFRLFVFAILGLVGAARAKDRPMSAGILMLVGGIGGFLPTRFWLVPGVVWLLRSFLPVKFWLLPGVLLLIGGILLLVSWKQKP